MCSKAADSIPRSVSHEREEVVCVCIIYMLLRFVDNFFFFLSAPTLVLVDEEDWKKKNSLTVKGEV